VEFFPDFKGEIERDFKIAEQEEYDKRYEHNLIPKQLPCACTDYIMRKCFCLDFSCESQWGLDENDKSCPNGKYFRFEKENNVICGGKMLEGYIEECPNISQAMKKPLTREEYDKLQVPETRKVKKHNRHQRHNKYC